MDRDAVFPFFADPHNLSRITPQGMGFRIITPIPIPMRAGALIDYVIRISGITLRWTTLITQYDPPQSFVDVQLKGPYSYWHHHHEFVAAENGTEVLDTVHYALPAGLLGTLAHALGVRRTLNRIFDHRESAIRHMLGGNRKEASG